MEKPRVSRTRLICWIALVASVSTLEYTARFSGTAAKDARNQVYSYSAFAGGLLFYAIIFGVWHGLVQALLVLIPFGIALAYLRNRTRSVIPGMIVHGLFNGAALAFALLS